MKQLHDSRLSPNHQFRRHLFWRNRQVNKAVAAAIMMMLCDLDIVVNLDKLSL
jgi:hypothetical protein